MSKLKDKRFACNITSADNLLVEGSFDGSELLAFVANKAAAFGRPAEEIIIALNIPQVIEVHKLLTQALEDFSERY